MNFCSRCGAALTDGVCKNCGVRSEGRTLSFSCDAQGGTLFGLYLKTFLLSIITLGIYSFWGRTEIRRYLHSSLLAGDDRFAWHGTGKELLLGWLKAMGFLIVFYCIFFVLSMADKQRGSAIAGIFFYLGIFAVIPWVLVGVQRYRLSRTSLRGIHFSSTAKAGEFAKIYYKGLLFTILTLGFYSPWFLNDIHGYMLRNSYYGDQPFGFDGQGKDLFGSYVIFILLLIPSLYLIGFWFAAKQHRYYADHTFIGSARFRGTMRGRDLLVLSIVNVLLVVFTLGIGYPWAVLRMIRFSCGVLTLENFPGFEGFQQRISAATATGEGMAGILEIDSDFSGGLGL